MGTNNVTPAPSDLTSKRSDKTAKIKGQPRLQAKDSKFDDALQDRNIDTERTADPKLTSLKTIILKDWHLKKPSSTTSDELNWQKDLQKCKGSNEATFRRTIMMDIIHRHEVNDKLDYICEAVWTSRRMPARTPTIQISQPKPDLAVAFNFSTIIPGGSLRNLSQLGELKGHVCPEGFQGDRKIARFIASQSRSRASSVKLAIPRQNFKILIPPLKHYTTCTF
ncbi:hypothetical protein LTR47_012028 [Exophiala xenobiotica]|nr:hypothetical protein LTR47_012028 [Exophiala xenobiotica]KAK5351845.1 hypothetical protein LTS03_011983 [Exophiala xenobiotica]KAK5357574.1 hypothetical protein LTR11_011321 [Exophiala xenobiotica]